MRLHHIFESKKSDSALLSMIVKDPVSAIKIVRGMIEAGQPVPDAAIWRVVERHPKGIGAIPNPSHDLQIFAIDYHSGAPETLQAIQEPTPGVVKAALQKNIANMQFVAQTPENRKLALSISTQAIVYFDNPTPEEQAHVAKLSPTLITDIENPTIQACGIALSNRPILLAVVYDKFLDDGREFPDALMRAAVNTNTAQAVRHFRELPVEWQRYIFSLDPTNFHVLEHMRNLDPAIEKQWAQYKRKEDRKSNLPKVGQRRPGPYNYNQDQLKLIRWFDQNGTDSISVRDLKKQPWGNTPYFSQLVKELGGRDIVRADLKSGGDLPVAKDVGDLMSKAKVNIEEWREVQRIFDDETNYAAVFHVTGRELQPYTVGMDSLQIRDLNKHAHESNHPLPPSPSRHAANPYRKADSYDREAIERDTRFPLGWVRYTQFGSDIWIDEVQSDLHHLLAKEGATKLKDLTFAMLLGFVQRMRRRGAERFFMPSYEMKTNLYDARPPISIYTDIPRKMRFKQAEVTGIDPKVDGQTAWLLESAKPKIMESEETTMVLYHGTCEDSAAALTTNGWAPRSGPVGGNMGQARYLYVTTEPEDALWFAQEKGCDIVLKIQGVPVSLLRVDPEDGVGESVEEELAIAARTGMPAKLVITKAIPASCFQVVDK